MTLTRSSTLSFRGLSWVRRPLFVNLAPVTFPIDAAQGLEMFPQRSYDHQKQLQGLIAVWRSLSRVLRLKRLGSGICSYKCLRLCTR